MRTISKDNKISDLESTVSITTAQLIETLSIAIWGDEPTFFSDEPIYELVKFEDLLQWIKVVDPGATYDEVVTEFAPDNQDTWYEFTFSDQSEAHVHIKSGIGAGVVIVVDSLCAA